MRTVTLSLPQLALVVATRAMAAAGVALLLGDRLDEGRRRAVGATLLAVGALTTLPLAAEVLSSARARRPMAPAPEPEHAPPGVFGATGRPATVATAP